VSGSIRRGRSATVPQTTGYRVSAKLLAREDFQAACASRNFGDMFRLMRQWDGASQDKISSPVEGLTQSRVSRIMRGDDRVAGIELVERIIDSLRIPGHYVGLAPRPWENEPSEVLEPEVTAVYPAQRTPSARELAAVAAPVQRVSEPARKLSLVDPQPAPTNEVTFTPHIERPVGLRPHIEQAFAEDVVTIDFAGLSGETLAGALVEPLDMVRSGRFAPSSVRIRILAPDTGQPWALPCRVEDLADEPAFRVRAAGIVDRSLSAILDAVAELRDLDAVTDAVAEVRVHRVAPLFKLYLINGREAFFGFYPITEHMVKTKGGVHAMYDLMGKDSLLFHHSADGDETSPAAQYVAQARTWFDSAWTSIARDYERDT
jgi:hypothetical protein